MKKNIKKYIIMPEENIKENMWNKKLFNCRNKSKLINE